MTGSPWAGKSSVRRSRAGYDGREALPPVDRLPEAPRMSSPANGRHPDSSSSLLLAAGQGPLPDFELLAPLGRGGFGEVWKARGPGGVEVALKFVRLEDASSRLELRALEAVKNIRHPHLLAVFGAWRQEKVLIMALE